MIFTNQVLTDGFTVDFQFARRARPKKSVVDTDLQLDDFTTGAVKEYFHVCAVDPGISQLFTASYGQGTKPHEVRRCSTKEYYTYTGSPARQQHLVDRKKSAGIEQVESAFPTAKTSNLLAYESHVRYYFQHMILLFGFYGPTTAEDRFRQFQGRQRAGEEIVNILVHGGKKYNKTKRKKTKINRKARKKRRHDQLSRSHDKLQRLILQCQQ